MPQDLLDLPPEVFQRVVHELVSDVGVVEAWKLRGVCRTFAAEIHHDIFAHQPKEILLASMDTSEHMKIFQNNLTVYLRNRLNKRLDANGMLVSKIQELWDYPTETLHIQDFQKRQECAARLIEGIVSDPDPLYWMAFIWDEQLWPHRHNHADAYMVPATAADKLIAVVAVGEHDLIPGLFELPENGDYTMFSRPLVIATGNRDTEMVRTLISCYKKLHPKNNTHPDIVDAIDSAIQIGNVDALELLIQTCRSWGHCYYSEKRAYRGWMQCSIIHDSVASLDTVIENRGGRKGMLTQEVVKLICRSGKDTMINHYIEKGLLDVNKVYSHTSPLIIATHAGNVRTMATLISAGADVDKATSDGTTPLFIASKKHRKGAMNYLLDNGANTDTDNWPECPKDAARNFLRQKLSL
ncbi:uncharacterized protein N0V89_001381 [Didymosphaeria variabile]|uniref:Ankyrin n=1 Tax=Didymosphaeria variabile TaxID=1932322 RepID=A0A9W9CGL5_9PLEO|nr:uncharacterized protein N0V89_001381 [Didymosphaeria variabile]KAJ4360814.1 hypothetical protein N0V89_001381 [Didymosphaeria variabile]